MTNNLDDDEEDASNVIGQNKVKQTTSSPPSHDDAHHDDPHAAQWERQGVWLTKLRAQKIELEQQGIKGFDLLEAMATLSINHKLSILQDHRCHRCWHDKSQHHCICEALQSLLPLPPPPEEKDFSIPSLLLPTPYTIKLCILMHHKEYYCAGNSAKLLLCLLPNHTELYLFGKQGEVDRLLRDITSTSTTGNSNSNSMILWPGDTAISVSEFLKHQECATNKEDGEKEEDKNPLPASEPLLINAIVLDGTYTQARNMHKSLRKRWGGMKDHPSNVMPVSVALRPSTSSVFHRAQKNYGKAHQQQQDSPQSQGGEGSKVLRISTAEACGLLLTEMGADQSIQEAITKSVLLNNRALDYARKTNSSSNSK